MEWNHKSYREAAETENVTRAVMLNETTRLRSLFTERQAEHAGFIFK